MLGDKTAKAYSTCSELASRFSNSVVSFPGDVEYERQQRQYWSALQSDHHPACRVTPRNPQDLSAILGRLHDNEIDFAIVSGGHGTAVGASNLDHGITVDLSSLSSISIASDKSSVSFGSGTQWKDVYELLEKDNITVAGARAGSVGAGGFLLGGGISTLATRYGWSCDNVTAIDLVLANGTHVEARKTQATDLFRALKGGGANFAVPARFEIKTFSFRDFEVVFVQYKWSQVERLIAQISECMEDWTDLDSSFDLSLSIDPATGEVFANLMLTRFGKMEASSIIQSLLGVPHVSVLNKGFTPGTLAAELDRSNPTGYRQHKWTLTISNGGATAVTIARKFASLVIYPGLPVDQAYRPGMLFQPISKAQLAQTTDNMLGFENETSSLLLISFEIRWSQSEYDEKYVRFSKDLLQSCRQIAEEYNVLHPFIYLNYAAADQDPFALLRQNGQLEKIKAIRARYDENLYLERHLHQPFKLGL